MNSVFQEASIGSVQVGCRILRSATHEGMGDRAGEPMAGLADRYVKLAQGGAGAIITGFVAIDKKGRALPNQRMFDDDRFIEAYAPITAAVKEAGAPIIAQLAHAGGQTHRKITGGEVVAPSEATYRLLMSRARGLEDSEIGEIIESFVAAVVRARKAGFSGVQLHAGHGYLLNEFLSPFTNRRNDRWGGSTEKRFRIVAEILSRAREAAGPFPLWAKLSAHDADRGGMTVDEAVRIAELCQRHGLDALEVSCGGVTDGFNSLRVSKIPLEAALTMLPWMASMPASKKMMLRLMKRFVFTLHRPLLNYNVEAAARIRQNVDIPVIAVGGIRRLSDIESIIGEGKADAVAMARPFIIEPDIVNRFRSGAQAESGCINCGYCLAGAAGDTLKCYRGKLPPGRRAASAGR